MEIELLPHILSLASVVVSELVHIVTPTLAHPSDKDTCRFTRWYVPLPILRSTRYRH